MTSLRLRFLLVIMMASLSRVNATPQAPLLFRESDGGGVCARQVRALPTGRPPPVVGLGSHGVVTFQLLSRTSGFYHMKSWAYVVQHATDFRPGSGRGDSGKPEDLSLSPLRPALYLDMNRGDIRDLPGLVIYDLDTLKAVASVANGTQRKALYELRGDMSPAVVLHSDISGIPVDQLPEEVKDFLSSLASRSYLENLELHADQLAGSPRKFEVISRKSDLQAQNGQILLDRLARERKIALIRFEDSPKVQIIIPAARDRIDLPSADFLRRARSLRQAGNFIAGGSRAALSPGAGEANRLNAATVGGHEPQLAEFKLSLADLEALRRDMQPWFVHAARPEEAPSDWQLPRPRAGESARPEVRGRHDVHHETPSRRREVMPEAEKQKAIGESEIQDAYAAWKGVMDDIILSEAPPAGDEAKLISGFSAFRDLVKRLEPLQIFALARQIKSGSELADLHEVLELLPKKSTAYRLLHETLHRLDLHGDLGLPAFVDEATAKREQLFKAFASATIAGAEHAANQRKIFDLLYPVTDSAEISANNARALAIHGGLVEDMNSLGLPEATRRTIGSRLMSAAAAILSDQKPNINPTGVEGISFLLIAGQRVFVKIHGRQLRVLGIASQSGADAKTAELVRRLKDFR